MNLQFRTGYDQHLNVYSSRLMVFFFIFVILLSIFFSLMVLKTPAPMEFNADSTQFSAERAMLHLEVIAKEPHPVGSEEHENVRNYIFNELNDLGLDPEIQEAGEFKNIMARINGTNSDSVIMLSAHYDTVSESPGAADDGMGVATILEVSRAIIEGDSIKHDLVLLFTDAEEKGDYGKGTLGAQAFVNEHPWSNEVEFVVNLEARGNSGPSIMFETSDQNGLLINEFKKAPYPVAYSFSYEVYKRMPNYTDFTVFIESGMQGLNFAPIIGLDAYHTLEDSVDNLNVGTMQGQGDNALSLVQSLGNMELGNEKDDNAVYFTVFSKQFISYSSKLVIPFMIAIALLFIFIFIYGIRKQMLSFRGTVISMFVYIVLLGFVYAIFQLEWNAVYNLFSDFESTFIMDHRYSDMFLIGFALQISALFILVYQLLNRKINQNNLSFGVLWIWFTFMIVCSLFLPGASYLFTWPLLTSLLGMFYVFIRGENLRRDSYSNFVLLLLAIPGIFIFVPVIYLLSISLTLNISGVISLVMALVFSLFVPILPVLYRKRVILFPFVLFMLGFLFVMITSLVAGIV
ncbi:M28 family peptidase [Chengkuizengella axinellae]|uniref:Vacuolar membrane protease n=1 Tax=Chengkuizengella axinellae TaxID=3064388 RepID=A0ABT9J466_9BACL|nr:M28 family peptidase [Chengkuizengella sp. 2205SS18-9]MDP5276398.1 M28 family peptidase [Chengkuizengella sp. 2205SS18-9]